MVLRAISTLNLSGLAAYNIMNQKLLAEGFGTGLLAFVVITSTTTLPIIATPVQAALVLGLLVYTIGSVSGCHINPAVTAGLWSIGKIERPEALRYIVAQCLGGLGAVLLSSVIYGVGGLSFALAPESMTVFAAEVMGTAVLTFGVASVFSGRVNSTMSGLVIGGSLLLGIAIAVQLGSAGILNPALALALGSLNLSYVFGALVGGVLGTRIYQRLIV